EHSPCHEAKAWWASDRFLLVTSELSREIDVIETIEATGPIRLGLTLDLGVFQLALHALDPRIRRLGGGRAPELPDVLTVCDPLDVAPVAGHPGATTLP